MADFWVVDLTAAGEARLKQAYEYALLERIGGAADLIALFSSHLWRSPDAFDTALPGTSLTLRWRACSHTSAIATLREADRVATLSVLLCGQQADDDAATLAPLQHHLVRELRDTGFEPAFDLMHLAQRPLVASIHFQPPRGTANEAAFALADRCVAASYFRKMGLA